MFNENEQNPMNPNAYPQTAQDAQNIQSPTAENPIVQPIQPAQNLPVSGSYYSPRSNGGTIPPMQEPVYSNIPPQQPPKKKSSHTGLKILGVVAGIGLVSVGSVSAYRFFSENEALQRFFGNGDSLVSESTVQAGSNKNDSKADGIDTSPTDESSATGKNNAPIDWYNLAAPTDAMSIPDIVDKVSPATVGISSTFVWKQDYNNMWGFGGGGSYEDSGMSTGTGIIMNKDGYVITNAHVVYQASYGGTAKEVQVTLNSEYYDGDTQIAATIVGYDVEEDIAVLKMDTDRTLVAAEFGDSDALRVGEAVIAIGNPLGLELFGSVTTGIVSALDREVTINETPMQLIQTDAAINSGNSGGPLINCYGQVIGINSAKMSSSYSSSAATVEGLGFAIPMSHAKNVIDDLIEFGYVRGKPLIGISGRDVTEDISQAYGMPLGVYVTEVVKGGAAEQGGIRVGDIIIAVNGESVSCYDELNAAKNSFSAGDTITITVVRNGSDCECAVTLQEKVPEMP